MRKYLLFILLPLFLITCIKDPNPLTDDQSKPYLSGDGLLLVNEGNFRSGNGSLSFFSYDSLKLYNQAFLEVNERPLGDIPYSVSIHDKRAYILVNNSNKIEVVSSRNLKSVAIITGVLSPRYIAFVNSGKAYVTSLFSDSLAVIDLVTNSISRYINIGKTSESIVIIGNKAYVANWVGGKEVLIINTENDSVTGKIEVAPEPESMVLDVNDNLWVLCNGGWKRENFAELIKIDTRSNEIVKRFTFPSVNDSPTCLQTDGQRETLYFIKDGIQRMNINDQELPSGAFIPLLGQNFYKIYVNAGNGEIFITDAGNYTDKGHLLRYNSEGTFISSLKAEIIPGGMCFRPNPDLEEN